MRTIRAGIIVAIVSVAFVVSSGPASAQYDGETGSLTTNTTSVAPGGSVEVSGKCYAADSEVELAVAGNEAGTTTANSVGAIDATVQIPASASGSLEITATGRTADGASCVLSTRVSIATSGGRAADIQGATATGATTTRSTSSGPSLPVTGTEITPGLVLTAIALLAVGAGLVVVARRRRNAA